MNIKEDLIRFLKEHAEGHMINESLKREIRAYIEQMTHNLVLEGMINPLFREDLYRYIIGTVNLIDNSGYPETIE